MKSDFFLGFKITAIMIRHKKNLCVITRDSNWSWVLRVNEFITTDTLRYYQEKFLMALVVCSYTKWIGNVWD